MSTLPANKIQWNPSVILNDDGGNGIAYRLSTDLKHGQTTFMEAYEMRNDAIPEFSDAVLDPANTLSQALLSSYTLLEPQILADIKRTKTSKEVLFNMLSIRSIYHHTNGGGRRESIEEYSELIQKIAREFYLPAIATDKRLPMLIELLNIPHGHTELFGKNGVLLSNDQLYPKPGSFNFSHTAVDAILNQSPFPAEVTNVLHNIATNLPLQAISGSTPQPLETPLFNAWAASSLPLTPTEKLGIKTLEASPIVQFLIANPKSKLLHQDNKYFFACSKPHAIAGTVEMRSDGFKESELEAIVQHASLLDSKVKQHWSRNQPDR